ncbi:MAG: ribonuclease E/G, partial [Candidatus Heimdallarchaeota archaeon]|nr:ribonuclease E/G [Candidatus Heimdallarchaeota archaeon]
MSNIIVRIDSIYGLALSKLLLDTGEVSLSNPNREILENLSINEEKHPHDVNISDLDNRTGIMLKGYPLAVKKIEKLFREELLDSIIFQHPVKQDAIYSAMVIKRIFKKRLSILDLGGDTRGIIFNSSAEVGEQIIVQVKELPTEIDKLPVCSTEITLGGDYVILEVEQDFVRVSRKLQGAEREALHNLGKLHQPPGFGIIIRTSAASANEDDIIKEINSLVDLWSEIHRQMEEDERGIKLVSGEMVSEVYF